VIPFLYRYRDALIVVWCLAWLPVLLPSARWGLSLGPVLVGLSLRAWARRYIGAHSRGRILSCAERSTGGPYRWFPHPLYLANLLVLTGLAAGLTGPRPPIVALVVSGPVLLYVFLARAESRLLRTVLPPDRSTPLDPTSGRWASEWASFLPPIAAWLLAMR